MIRPASKRSPYLHRPSGSATIPISLSDGYLISDTNGFQYICNISLSDNSVISDIVSQSSIVLVSSSDGLTMSDANGIKCICNISSGDSLLASDIVSLSFTLSISSSDSLIISDSPLSFYNVELTISDAATLSDLCYTGSILGHLYFNAQDKSFYFIAESKKFRITASKNFYFTSGD